MCLKLNRNRNRQEKVRDGRGDERGGHRGGERKREGRGVFFLFLYSFYAEHTASKLARG